MPLQGYCLKTLKLFIFIYTSFWKYLAACNGTLRQWKENECLDWQENTHSIKYEKKKENIFFLWSDTWTRLCMEELIIRLTVSEG